MTKYPCHTSWTLTCSPLGPWSMLLHQLQWEYLWSHQPAQEEEESSTDTLGSGREVVAEVGGGCWPSIWLTEGNAIMVLQQYRPTKRLQVSASGLPGWMTTSILVHWPACTCTDTSHCLIKVELMQPHRNKIFLPFDNLRPTTGSSRWTNLHLIDAQCQSHSKYVLISSHEVPECVPLLKVLLLLFYLTEANSVNVSTDIHCSKGTMAEGWESAGRIWLWHLLTRRDRERIS